MDADDAETMEVDTNNDVDTESAKVNDVVFVQNEKEKLDAHDMFK